MLDFNTYQHTPYHSPSMNLLDAWARLRWWIQWWWVSSSMKQAVGLHSWPQTLIPSMPVCSSKREREINAEISFSRLHWGYQGYSEPDMAGAKPCMNLPRPCSPVNTGTHLPTRLMNKARALGQLCHCEQSDICHKLPITESKARVPTRQFYYYYCIIKAK